MKKNMLKYIINNIRSIFINKYIIIYTLIILCSLVNSANSNSIKKKILKQKPVSISKTHKLSNYFQKGMASWYGSRFHGKKTANGERFNMYNVSAAHKSLPLGTIIKVTNLKNHKSIIVEITDRGPVGSNRIIDLSFKAAELLTAGNSKRVGLFPVVITIIKRV